jgi:phospholipase C
MRGASTGTLSQMEGGAPEPEGHSPGDYPDGRRRISRRAVLGYAGLAAGALGPIVSGAAFSRAMADPPVAGGTPIGPSDPRYPALKVLGRQGLRFPDSLPYPDLPAGTDTMPGIEHIVVLVMENHSFDNLLGMLGRGDGFKLGPGGLPTATNPYPDGSIQHAFHMPTTCQLPGVPSQEWGASHIAYDNGAMDGFVRASNSKSKGGVVMGFWTQDDLPFTNGLASSFPLADRWFCSVLGQTDPNRRYLIAATSGGMTNDINAPGQFALLAQTVNGTIFQRLTSFGIDWANYATQFPLGATPELFPVVDNPLESGSHLRTFDQFFTDAAAGTLPSFSFLDENYGTQSQENPQNLVVGEAMLARVVQALGNGPGWANSLLVLTYDEHGGYYDHVPPPVALAPDSLAPVVAPGESTYDGFERYGFRVPGLIVSPYSKRQHVSHTVFDHTSMLALVERKWNLPAMTYRDANANDLTDLIDLNALARGRPNFPVLPPLPASGDTPEALACSTSGPGVVPPPGSISPAP